ncbi:hypothetical protein [Paraburkholderia aspalathi]|uniref:Uncharacterized protein n=1 Tax=Paraburkholderia aspalathi TaxID=1324617 RepID=A0A1I7ER74_9BURK|nr:hypothetical protein [Paraburkholderia aspalathi]SFU26425.1 hypothetical protein SAMN05192563_105434 [Paraburkholderia aspalathi]
MKQMNQIISGLVPVALGRLEELSSFGDRPKMAAGLPDDMPFLTFPLRLSEARCLGTSGERGNFGFGHIELEDGMLMTIRLQLDGVLFYWLAEMTDPELWAAIDKWRGAGRVPIGLKIDKGGRWDIAFLSMGIGPSLLTDEKYRAAPRRVVTAHDWRAMSGLSTGFVPLQATTDIPGVPLEHVFASALLTEQFEAVAYEELLVKKPVVVKAPHGRLVLI